MHSIIVYSVLCTIIKHLDAKAVIEDYNNERNGLLKEESMLSLGGKLILSKEELKANEIMMHWKEKELNASFYSPQYFNFSRHYFTYKKYIETSKVYQMIRRMPKGAVLHLHNSFMLDADSMLDLTYEDHLYACYSDDNLIFHFSETIPKRPCSTKWSLLSELRNASRDTTKFDHELKKYFSMYSENYNDLNMDINHVWKQFDKVYDTIKSLITYRPVREKFFYAGLKKFYEDNVMYIEIRSGLHGLYELNGTVHDKMYLAEMFERLVKKFQVDHPDFVGVKLILTKHRTLDITKVYEGLELARKVKREMPQLLAGLDLIGQEDLGKPLTDFLPALVKAKGEFNFYFHGGETNWFGTSTDENLFDAVLLGSRRIGHAYALLKHPSVLAAVKRQDIALEVNVISNAVLALVRDVRNHPLAAFLAQGLPVVLSSDDPGAWGAAPLSHDFYVTFMGVASYHDDLKLLKQLAINSISYSALDDKGKANLFKVFNRRWDMFINELIASPI